MITKLTARDRITKAHMFLMKNKDWAWLAPTCLIGNVIVDDSVPTAATNGRDCWYGKSFIDKLNDKQVRATVVHENFHKAFRHLLVYKYLVDRHGGQIVNMAMDFVINRYIVKDKENLETWEPHIKYCYDPKYDDDSKWDTPRIVEDLLQQGKGKGEGEGDGEGGMDGHNWAEAQEMSEEEQRELEKQIEQAIRQGQFLSKKMNGNAPRSIDDLLTPAVDWRQALRDFVTERVKGGDYATYAKPNRRYVGYNMHMPSTYTEAVKSILFACDTSGSIGPDDLREVLSEVQGCIETVCPETVDVMYWDTAVARHEHYEGADVSSIMSSTKPAGGGGTAPGCVVAYCQERGIKPAVVIWLSDGYVGGDWGEGLGVPAFWVISSGGQCPSHLPHVQLPAR